MNPRFGLFKKLGGLALAGITLVGSVAAVGARENSSNESGKPLRVVVHVSFADAGRRSIRPEGLLPLVTTVPSGAFEIVRRRQDGFSYFKP